MIERRWKSWMGWVAPSAYIVCSPLTWARKVETPPRSWLNFQTVQVVSNGQVGWQHSIHALLHSTFSTSLKYCLCLKGQSGICRFADLATAYLPSFDDSWRAGSRVIVLVQVRWDEWTSVRQPHTANLLHYHLMAIFPLLHLWLLGIHVHLSTIQQLTFHYFLWHHQLLIRCQLGFVQVDKKHEGE